MTSTNAESNILKQDTRGRVRTPLARREELLDEFERSGLSGMRFAKMVGIKYATFALWVAKRRKSREQGAGIRSGSDHPDAGVEQRPIRLFEALSVTSAGPNGMGLTIDLPGGARLVADSSAQLQLAAELIRLLANGGARTC